MAHVELELISNVVERQDWRDVHASGLTPEHFLTEEGYLVFNWIYEEHKKDRTVPDKKRLLRKFPSFEFCASTNPTKALIRELRESGIRSEARTVLEDLTDALENGEDPMEALQLYLPSLKDLMIEFAEPEGVFMSKSAKEMQTEYLETSNSGGILGFPYPWAPLNEATGGIQRGQFVVLFARPKQMKCVAAGQRVMARNGELVPIEELPEFCEVPSFTEETQQFRWAKARRVTSGPKECVEVVTEDGHRVVTSTEHYFMVPEGPFEERFARIQDLPVGSWVAVERRTPAWDGRRAVSPRKEADRLWFLGALIGDGNYTRNEVQFTNEDANVILALTAVVEQLGGRVVPGSRPIEFRVTGTSRGTGSNPVLNLLREEGVWGQKSENKTTPRTAFTASPAGVMAYLAGLLDTDGTVKDGPPSRCCKWYTSSQMLAQDIQHLLARIAVHASVQPVPSRQSFVVAVQDHDSLANVSDLLAPFMRHQEKREALRRLGAEDLKTKPHDGIPESTELRELIYSEKGNRPWPSWLSPKKLFRRTGRISRKSLHVLADAWGSERLRRVAMQERRWVRIRAINPVGTRECFDVTILDGQDPNFVVEGFTVHNTWTALAIAAHCYLESGLRVAIYSKEMTVPQMRRRVASIIAGLDDGQIRTATLSPDDEGHYFDTLDALTALEDAQLTQSKKPSMMFLSDKGVKGGSTPESLRARIERFEPDVLIVDGFYLMRDARSGKKDRDWKTVSNISADLKEMALEMNIGIIGTTQANRSSDKDSKHISPDDLSGLAFADAIGQDADVVIQIIKGKDPNTGKPILLLLFPGVRDAEIRPFVINANPGKDFSLRQRKVNIGAFLEEAKKLWAQEAAEEEAANSGEGGTPKEPVTGGEKQPVKRKRTTKKEPQRNGGLRS